MPLRVARTHVLRIGFTWRVFELLGNVSRAEKTEDVASNLDFLVGGNDAHGDAGIGAANGWKALRVRVGIE